MNCPFNVTVINQDYKEPDYSQSDSHSVCSISQSQYVVLIECPENENICQAWVDTIHYWDWEGELKCMIRKRCARLVNPKDIITR